MTDAKRVPVPAGLDVADETVVREGDFARILLLGAGRTGKTTAVALTAPAPVLILNCDDRNATRPASAHGAKFTRINVTGARSLAAACAYAVAAAEAGEFRTIALDTITMLSDTLVSELKARGVDGFELWNQRDDALFDAVKRLDRAQAHVFACAHITPGVAHVGVLPSMQGQRAKTLLPQYFTDWIMFEVDPSKTTAERNFLIGPQQSWTAGGRNIHRSCKVPADVGLLFKELGINP